MEKHGEQKTSPYNLEKQDIRVETPTIFFSGYVGPDVRRGLVLHFIERQENAGIFEELSSNIIPDRESELPL